jgi:hypothetical protein
LHVFYAKNGLQHDYELAVIALSGGENYLFPPVFILFRDIELVRKKKGVCNRKSYKLTDFADTVRTELGSYEAFFAFLLGTVSKNNRGSLAVLDQGLETSLAYKRLILEFLDVPPGWLVPCMRKGIQNLENSEWHNVSEHKARMLRASFTPIRPPLLGFPDK